MLKGVLKKMGMQQAVLPEDKGVDMSVVDNGISAEFEQLKADFSAQGEQLKAALEQVASLQEFAQAANAAKAQAEAEAKQVKMDARKATITESVGTSKADALLAATENLDDASFAAIMGAMAVNAKAEEQSPMFSEQGIDGKVEDVSKLAESKEMIALKKKFAAKTAKSH